MVLLPPAICITLLQCKKTWKQAKMFSIRRANCHNTYEIRFWGGVQVWMYIGYLLQLVYSTPSRFSWVKHISSIRITHTQKNVVKIFVSQICIFYKNDSHTKQNPDVCWPVGKPSCVSMICTPGTFLMSQGVARDFYFK